MALTFKNLFIVLFFILLFGCSSSHDTNKPASNETSKDSVLPNDTLKVFCTEDHH